MLVNAFKEPVGKPLDLGLAADLRLVWAEAAFAEVSPERLAAYYAFNLRELGRLPLDTANFELLRELASLAADLPGGSMVVVTAPRAVVEWWLARLAAPLALLRERLASGQFSGSLVTCLQSYLLEMTEPGYVCAYAALVYFERWVLALAGLKDEASVRRCLLRLDFNYWSFLVYLRAELEERLLGQEGLARVTALRQERYGVLSLGTIGTARCFADWAPVRALWSDWLAEELVIAERLLASPVTEDFRPKLRLSLSTAQIGCFLRAAQAVGIFGDLEMQPLFRWVTGLFSSKRQVNGSDAGLSKEFYNINQKTAATVRDLLLRMVGYLDQTFFPR